MISNLILGLSLAIMVLLITALVLLIYTIIRYLIPMMKEAMRNEHR